MKRSLNSISHIVVMSPFTYGNLTPLGPLTTWVHIFPETLDLLVELQMSNNFKERRML
jgi:hypothetical protein